MHNGTQYDPIHCQGQGHEPLKTENPFSKAISSAMGAGN